MNDKYDSEEEDCDNIEIEMRACVRCCEFKAARYSVIYVITGLCRDCYNDDGIDLEAYE